VQSGPNEEKLVQGSLLHTRPHFASYEPAFCTSCNVCCRIRLALYRNTVIADFNVCLPFVCLSMHVFVSPATCPLIYPSIYPLSNHPSICISVCVCTMHARIYECRLYRVSIKEHYTFKMTQKANGRYLELHTHTSR
jgi:hypothetical protein